MKYTRKFFMALAITITPLPAFASLDGIWWNPNIPGEGWNCSSQADTMFCLQYGYEGGDLRPTFRSVIAALTFQVLPDGDVRVNATGDVYRTQSFTDTVRTGAFTGSYEAGVFRINAAGQIQTLVPFAFNYAGDLEALTGVFVGATVPSFSGGAGTSLTILINNTILTASNGLRYKEAVSSNSDAAVLVEFEGALVLYQAPFPLPQFVDVQVMPTIPHDAGVLVGTENWRGRYGFVCRAEVATGICVTPFVDAVLFPIANSAGEGLAYAQITGQLAAPAKSPGESVDLADQISIFAGAKLVEQYRAFVSERAEQRD